MVREQFSFLFSPDFGCLDKFSHFTWIKDYMEYLTSFQNEGGGFEFNKYHIKWEGEGTNQMDN